MENEKKTGDKYSKLAGNTLIFAISSFSSKLLTLIVQPFLTYAMAEISDLGLSKILSQYANLLIPRLFPPTLIPATVCTSTR